MLGVKTNATGPLSLKSSVQEGEYTAVGEGVGALIQMQETAAVQSQMPDTA